MKRGALSQEEMVRVASLHERGWSTRAIAQYIDRPIGTVASFKTRYGLTSKGDPPTAEEFAARIEQSQEQRQRSHEGAVKRERQRRNDKIKKPPAGDSQATPAVWQARFLKPEDRRAGR